MLYSADAARGAALIARFPGLLEARLRAPANVKDLLIVRPDGYVGLSARARDWAAPERYLQRMALAGADARTA